AGGLGGHNGLRSAKGVLGTADFWRLRFGVGKPADGNVADYVLGSFSPDERIILSQVFAQAAILFGKLLTSRDPQRLVPEWGKKKCMA
ncbi:MAG: peptidyl-tRNA hydrolase, partial [Treponema sp.]|nr:peptidyl-tRNA hydrolase [Treponema sp.]